MVLKLYKYLGNLHYTKRIVRGLRNVVAADPLSTLSTRFGQDAPGRIRGQATAQTHQGPLRGNKLAGLGTTTARESPARRQYLPVAILGCFDYPARA